MSQVPERERSLRTSYMFNIGVLPSVCVAEGYGVGGRGRGTVGGGGPGMG